MSEVLEHYEDGDEEEKQTLLTRYKRELQAILKKGRLASKISDNDIFAEIFRKVGDEEIASEFEEKHKLMEEFQKKDTSKKDVIRANELAWLIHALENGLDPENYEPVFIANKPVLRSLSRLPEDEVGYHPKDQLVPVYVEGSSFQHPVIEYETRQDGKLKTIYRLKDAKTVPISTIWDPKLKWYQIKERIFMGSARRVINPMEWLQDLRKMKNNARQDVSELDEAIRELSHILGIESGDRD